MINFLSKFDIIHFHTVWDLKIILIAYFSRMLGIKLILIPHGTFDKWSLREKFLRKKLFSLLFLNNLLIKLDAIFFSTIDEFFEAKHNFKLPYAYVIPNGINLKKFQQIQNNNLEIKKKRKIIFFGRIHKKKGIELLLKSIKKLPDSFFSNYFFEITGPGEKIYIKKIIKIISNYKLQKKVFLLGPKNTLEKKEYFKTADLFILPSFEEADSIALKEAMALNLPVIISEQCRMDVVEEKKSGFVVKTSVNSVVEALINLDNFDLKKMGNNSRKIIENYYDNEKCSKRVFKIYEDVYTGGHLSNDWINLNE